MGPCEGLAGRKLRALNSDLERTRGQLEAARAEVALAKTSADERVAALQKTAEAEKARAEEAIRSAKAGAEAAQGSSATRIAALEQQLSGAKTQNDTLASDLLSAKKDLEAARRSQGTAQAATAALEQARAESEALKGQLAQAKADTEVLQAKVASDQEALRSAGDTSGKTKALSAELEQAKADLAATQAQLADAKKLALAARQETEGQGFDKASLEKQVADLSQKLAAAQTATLALQEENARLKRSSPLRPSAVVAAQQAPAAQAPAPAPVVRTHVVSDGDTLTKISLRYYGTANKWSTIYQANRDKLPNESVLSIGTVLRIP